jgi:hypothetical protein
MIINYDHNHSSKVLATVITIINYNCKTFIVQATDVNFTNILLAAFLYESFLPSFYVFTIWVCNFLAK